MGIRGAMADVKKQMVDKKYISAIAPKKKKGKSRKSTAAAPAAAEPVAPTTGAIQVPVVINLGVIGGVALKSYFPQNDA